MVNTQYTPECSERGEGVTCTQLSQFETDSFNITTSQNAHKILFKQGHYIHDKIFPFAKAVLTISQFKFRYKTISMRTNETSLNFQHFDIDLLTHTPSILLNNKLICSMYLNEFTLFFPLIKEKICIITSFTHYHRVLLICNYFKINDTVKHVCILKYQYDHFYHLYVYISDKYFLHKYLHQCYKIK